MPRTIAAECPGCPPLRAITTDVLGLVKVVEARGQLGVPTVVETWGSPEASAAVIAASYADRATDPILAVARKNSSLELINPLNGDILATTNVDESTPPADDAGGDDHVVGLHLLKSNKTDCSSRSELLLTCTEKGKACLKSVLLKKSSEGAYRESSSSWNICNAGKVICSVVDTSKSHALFGGKGIELNAWNLENQSKTWTAKPPPSNNLGIFTPTWFTAATFLYNDDYRKIVAGTNSHQVRLYDTSAQRRPVLSVDFRESPIKAVTNDPDGYKVYIGTGFGDLASFDMRTGKLLGCFIGKCSGSIRSIARHPELPILASCGLDSYVRFWDANTRQLLSAVFLKQHITNVVIDSHFSDKGIEVKSADQTTDPQDLQDLGVEDEELRHSDRSSKSKGKKRKMKAKNPESSEDPGFTRNGVENEEELLRSKEKTKRSKSHKGKKSTL